MITFNHVALSVKDLDPAQKETFKRAKDELRGLFGR